MRIDGKAIADAIYKELRERVGELQKKGKVPHLAVILVGENPASIAYVLQKQKKGEAVGCKVTVIRYNEHVTTDELARKIQELNNDESTHAILLQRPLPPHIDIPRLELLTDPKKDIDGFHPDSPFILPLPLAAVRILEEIYSIRLKTPHMTFRDWLRTQMIVVIGKGETGGKPIVEYLNNLQIPYKQIDSKTPNPKEITRQADVIISAVGKQNVVKPDMIKKGVILISVGICRGNDGKLHGDYEEEAIKDITSFYTPTPGGVGPVNVAILIENLLMAAGNVSRTP